MAAVQRGHRLERLFSRRRSSNLRRATPCWDEPSEPVFPQASFIRPKSTRMMAREEGASRTPSPRKESFLDQRASFPISFDESTVVGDGQLEYELQRASRLLERQDSKLPELQVFGHSKQLTSSGEVSPISLATTCSPAADEPVSPRDKAALGTTSPVPQPHRLKTPERHCFPRSRPYPKLRSPAPNSDMPTPEPSPGSTPVSDAGLDDTRGLGACLGLEIGPGDLPREDVAPLDTSLSVSLNDDDRSDSEGNAGSPILKEPTVFDFMDLSDDDIAEDQPESLARDRYLPPSPPSTASSSSPTQSRSASLLTSSSPSASRPAAAAAFEVARIAARHNFDLVYVVNLWPDNVRPDGCSTPTSPSDLSGGGTGTMTGRLLAAYGLSTVMSPFRISSAVHTMILQADGWIEYRNEEADKDDFARGYACAFHKGHFGRPQDTRGYYKSSTKLDGGTNSINRGIVFAAYRKPVPGGDGSAVNCSKDELSSIYHDAEKLVEMLIDINMANRLKQTSGYGLYTDETGPMPASRVRLVTIK